jgi:AraC family transcriptional regulator
MIGSESRTFTVSETHGRVLRSENHLVAQSHDLGWCGLYAAIFEEGPYRGIEPAIPHPYLIYHLDRPTEVTRKIEGFHVERALIGPRRICLAPGGAVIQTRHVGRAEILQLYIRQSVYEDAVREMYDCDAAEVEIMPRYAILDPLLEQLLLKTRRALQDGLAEDRVYMDTVAQMIAVHLARHHSSSRRVPRTLRAETIANWKMQTLLEFIEQNLHTDLSVTRMAAEVGMSPLSLPKAFRTATGQSPHQYILKRRIECAKKLLFSTDMPIVDVSLSVGFSSQSHLGNWFRRVVGISPAEYRRQGFQ